MKTQNFKASLKGILILILIFSFASSCNEDQSILQEESLTESFLRSDAFTSLNINKATIDLSRSTINEKGNATYVIIPFKENIKYIIGKTSKSSGKNIFKSASVVTYETSLNLTELASSLQDKTFTGGLNFSYSDGFQFSFRVVEGKVDFQNFKYKNSSNKRVNGCGTVGSDLWVERVLGCADREIQSLGTVGTIACYMGIVQCVAIAAADCIEAGCPY